METKIFQIASNRKDGYSNRETLQLIASYESSKSKEDLLKLYAILHLRLETRYFIPLRAISSLGFDNGEGFSAVCICCSLIEFYQMLLLGFISDSEGTLADLNGEINLKSDYYFTKTGNKKIFRSKDLSAKFLLEQESFSNRFMTEDIVKSFYQNVRSKLIHQLETKEGWLIHAGVIDGPIIESYSGMNTVYYKPLIAKLENWYDTHYRQLLLDSSITSRNFVFVLKNICG